MQQSGSCTRRLLVTRLSALSIITSLLGTSDSQQPVIPQIQREIIDKRLDLDDTPAGLELTKNYAAAWQLQRQELVAMRSLYEQALQTHDEHTAKSLEIYTSELEQRLRAAEMAERDLRWSLESLFASKIAAYQLLCHDAQQEESEICNQSQKLETEYRALDQTLQRDSKVFQNETISYQKDCARLKSATERGRLDKLQEERKSRYEQKQKRNRTRQLVTREEIAKGKKRRMVKKNLIAILGVLGGVAITVAGGATVQIPIVVAGIGILGSAAMKLDFSTKKKQEQDTTCEPVPDGCPMDDHFSTW